jgi:hypothetical protein
MTNLIIDSTEKGVLMNVNPDKSLQNKYLDAREELIKTIIDEFHAELDLDTMNKLADGRLIWDGISLRNSRGEILS